MKLCIRPAASTLSMVANTRFDAGNTPGLFVQSPPKNFQDIVNFSGYSQKKGYQQPFWAALGVIVLTGLGVAGYMGASRERFSIQPPPYVLPQKAAAVFKDPKAAPRDKIKAGITVLTYQEQSAQEVTATYHQLVNAFTQDPNLKAAYDTKLVSPLRDLYQAKLNWAEKTASGASEKEIGETQVKLADAFTKVNEIYF